jgi:hypothetical protein
MTSLSSTAVREPAAWADDLARGDAGKALLPIYLARTGTGPWHAAHQWATAMTRAPIHVSPDRCGLYHGAVAVAYVLHTAAHAAYARALENLDQHITGATRTRLASANRRIDAGYLPELREFDLISGLTGTAVYLLHRNPGHELLPGILAYLVRLTSPIRNHGESVPGWWTGNGPADQPSADWPGGHGNLGMAHGITGPLALLSTAMRRGVTVPGQATAISTISQWLDQWRTGTSDRAWWPGLIARRDLNHPHRHPVGPQRPSWCYGTPGIARAQQLAGIAISDPSRQYAAEQALAGCVTDKRQLAQLEDASLCHGWAGLVLATWRAATDAQPGSTLPALIPQISDQLHSTAAHNLPAGAEDGFLLGAAGVDLTTQTIADGRPPECPWDACLLLGG